MALSLTCFRAPDPGRCADSGFGRGIFSIDVKYEKLAARARKLDADIYFWDEAGFRADAVQGRTWGKKGETPTWSSSVYLREGDKWKNVFYAETKVTDPKSQPAKAKTGETKAPDAKRNETSAKSSTSISRRLHRPAMQKTSVTSPRSHRR